MKKITTKEIERQQKLDEICCKLGVKIIIFSTKRKNIKKEMDFIWDCIISGWEFKNLFKKLFKKLL